MPESRFDRLIRVRRARERARQERSIAARRRERLEIDREETLRCRLAEAQAHYRTDPDRSTGKLLSIGEIRHQSEQRDALRGRVHELAAGVRHQHARRTTAESEREGALRRVTLATRRRQTLERGVQRERARDDADAERREERQLEETAEAMRAAPGFFFPRTD